MIEMRRIGGLCEQRTPLEEWFRILDWFKKVTKSGLGLHGTQWPAYIHVLSIVQEGSELSYQ
jgi:hypothetical protein